MRQKRSTLLGIAVLLLLALAFLPAQAAADSLTFNLNVDFCSGGCLGGLTSGGTVTIETTTTGLPANTTGIKFTITLDPSLSFHQVSGLDAFMFNGPAGLTFTGMTSGFTGVTSGGPFHEDGAGYFSYIVQYNTQPGVDGHTLTFTVYIAGQTLSLASVANLNGGFNPPPPTGSKVDFAANVSNGTCTGLIGGGNGLSQSTPSSPGGGGGCTPGVPEPGGLALLGSGLLALGGFVRKFK